MKKFDVVPFPSHLRYNFTAIMREMVAMGFIWSNCITEDSKKDNILGFFLKEVR